MCKPAIVLALPRLWSWLILVGGSSGQDAWPSPCSWIKLRSDGPAARKDPGSAQPQTRTLLVLVQASGLRLPMSFVFVALSLQTASVDFWNGFPVAAPGLEGSIAASSGQVGKFTQSESEKYSGKRNLCSLLQSLQTLPKCQTCPSAIRMPAGLLFAHAVIFCLLRSPTTVPRLHL